MVKTCLEKTINKELYNYHIINYIQYSKYNIVQNTILKMQYFSKSNFIQYTVLFT